MSGKAMRLADLERHLRGESQDTVFVDLLLERADRILTADGGRECERVLTDVEIDRLLAGDEPKDAA